MNVIFGRPWDAPVLDDRESYAVVETPVGRACLDCSCPITEGERGFLRPVARPDGQHELWAVHMECDLLSVIGHSLKVCNCTHPHLTRREQALFLLIRINEGRKRRGLDFL